jgi:hypothetical protein
VEWQYSEIEEFVGNSNPRKEEVVMSITAKAKVLPPPTPEEQSKINELMRAARSYTHPITFKEENSRGETVTHVGTVVCLQRGERLFGFTAAHNVSDKTGLKDDIAIYFRLRRDSKRTRFGILSARIHPEYDPEPRVSKYDLAILELEPNESITAGDFGQLFTGGFGKAPKGKPKIISNAFFWVVGFPSERARAEKDRTVLNQCTFCAQILEHSPKELAFYYPKRGYQMPHDGTTCELGDMPSTPEGFSGAGVWVIDHKPGELFIPHRHMQLVGIEIYWGDVSRLARCVPSKVIADFFKECYPEL